MAGRRSMTRQGKSLAAAAALALLASWHAVPAAASSNAPPIPDEGAKSAAELDALSAARPLVPRTGKADLDSPEKTTTPPRADGDKSVSDSRPAMTTRLPGFSDEQMARYKRQMYRTDI